MNENTKTIQVEERTFLIKKMNAKSSLKLAKTILAKSLPAFSVFFEETKAKKVETVKENDMFLAIQNCLDSLEDNDLDKVIDTSLQHCSEILPAGATNVLNIDGTYGVANIDTDVVLTLRLVTEVLLFNYEGFFDVSLWRSKFSPIVDTFKQNVKM
mgnify:CR=1 FL=1